MLFRPLELPQRATEFLGGVVRAQIDRLTPWTANDAVFGWSEPAEAGADRIAVTVAATARALVQPLVDALTAAGAEAVSVTATPPGGAAITVLDHQAPGTLDFARVRRALVAVLIVTGLLGGRLAQRRGARRGQSGKPPGRTDAPHRRAARGDPRRTRRRTGSDPVARARAPQVRQTPSSVIVLEVLSQILPDHTYVTELRIEGDKLRVIGVTRDAPGLIRLIEQSPNFTRATFFAPTTKAPTDPGERFHIEAQIEPVFAFRS